MSMTWPSAPSRSAATPTAPCATRPRPASELSRLIILKGLVDFFFGIHDKWAVLYNGLIDRTALQHQYFGGFGSIFESTILGSIYVGSVVMCDGLPTNLKAIALVVINTAIDTTSNGTVSPFAISLDEEQTTELYNLFNLQ